MDYYDDEITVYALVRDVFIASAFAGLIWTLHHLGRGVLLGARVKAYEGLADAYAPEEREVLIRRIKSDSLQR